VLHPRQFPKVCDIRRQEPARVRRFRRQARVPFFAGEIHIEVPKQDRGSAKYEPEPS
jgi:hypothetical protein